MRSQLFFIIIFSIFVGYLGAQDLYDFNLNTRVNINGQPHFKINYYPGTTKANYKGDFYPDLETNPNVDIHTFVSDCTVSTSSDYRVASFVNPPVTLTSSGGNSISSLNSVLVVPAGVTVTFARPYPIAALIIKGRVVLDPNAQSDYPVSKTIIFPGGVFESVPKTNLNHSIFLNAFEPWNNPVWDPLVTSPFISLGGNVTIRGLNSDSVWAGSNSSYTSYDSTFLRSFPFTTDGTPVFKMSGVKTSTTITYSMNNYYTKLTKKVGGYTNDGFFDGAGYIFMNPWSKNVWITGSSNSSMVFTGSSIVNIQNTAFYDVGHTTPDPIDDNTLDASNNINHIGSNIPDRYPITLLHNKLAVIIQNNMFAPLTRYNPVAKQSSTPRAYIGAKRSFGTISGNAFALINGISGISLLYGTEQFDVSFNAFISVFTDLTTPASRSYPDIDYLNGGIVTTSPYCTYEGNAFEGNFKGGAVQVIPIQSRSTQLGLSSDILLGTFSGNTQINSDNKTNNLWNSVVFKNHFFAGQAEFRVTYALTSQPPIKINFLGGWFIGQKASSTLPANVANIELFYDSPYIANTLSVCDNKGVIDTNTHTGEYNAISIKNAIALSTYTFFSTTFKSKYISITDSKFSHFSSNSDFIKRYTNQLYLSNVNGTKINPNYSVSFFFPLFNLLPPAAASPVLPTNQVNLSFIPNFDYTFSDGQSVNFLVNDAVQSTIPTLAKSNFVINQTSTWNVVNFPTLSNGLYSVLVSAKAKVGSSFYESGPFFANTFVFDSNAPNFYLGIDLTPTLTLPKRALTIFGKQWTKCGWVNSVGKCTTTGLLSNVSPTPSSVLESTTGSSVTASDEVSMLTSYLMNDVSSSIPSTLNITLDGNQVYKFFIYSYNPSYTGSIIDKLPIFTIKINGKYQEPFTRTIPSYQKYQKFGPFFWNNDLSTSQVLNIEWASDNTKYAIPICGIEIYSSITTAFAIPTS